jgi:hypothetical protein
VNRIDIEIPCDVGDGWLPGLPQPGVVCDIRPVIDPAKFWPHLLVLGPIAGVEYGKQVVRVPSSNPKHGAWTMYVQMDPTKTEWRPIVVPEVIHA